MHVVVQKKTMTKSFLYKMAEGPAGHSYGINVARLAGLRDAVLNQAKI